MKKLILMSVIGLFLIGCGSNDPKPDCEVNNTFELEFTNGTTSSYGLYINDVFQEIIKPKSKVTYDVPAGYWSAEVRQTNGYILIPTVKEYSNTYDACTKYYIVF